jgi:hypothetical protein
MVNTAHASDSVENAKREMGIVHIDHNDCSSIIDSIFYTITQTAEFI